MCCVENVSYEVEGRSVIESDEAQRGQIPLGMFEAAKLVDLNSRDVVSWLSAATRSPRLIEDA